MGNSTHALRVIEFQSALEIVAAHAVSSLGAERLLTATPGTDTSIIRAEFSRVDGATAFLQSGGAWGVNTLPDLEQALRRVRIPGTVLDPSELRDVGSLLAAGRITLSQFSSDNIPPRTSQSFSPLLTHLHQDSDLERAISRIVGADGEVLDTASPVLRRLRRELGDQRQRLVALLDRTVAALESHQKVVDMGVTVRDGRYVIAVRREARSAVGGIVHDTSATGATLFMEPPAAIEHGNRVRELEGEERREVERVLREITLTIMPTADRLAASLATLAHIDSLFARAHFARAVDAHCCTLVPAMDGFAIFNGRHPLLVAQGLVVVPFTLEMSPAERTLLISGPNTGGKTVLLKAVAMLSAMAQSGIPVPASPESTIPVFEDFFADIGDEQSLQASLSTFSAHLRNINDILSKASSRSLILMDEIGSGTDPTEGAALAAAVLEELTSRGAVTLATTHLGVLQGLAAENPGIVNASLQFDPDRLAPTYRFVKGIPGRSWGLGIARRLGLPKQIVERAEERIPREERNLAELIASLEVRDREAAERSISLGTREADMAALQTDLENRDRELREAKRDLERESRKGSRRFLLQAREQVEQVIAELRANATASPDASARASRRRIEELASEHDDAIRALDESDPASSPAQASAAQRGISTQVPGVGDPVFVDTIGGQRGLILSVRGGDAVVAVGSVKLAVPLRLLRVAPVEKQKKEFIPVRGDLPEERADSEIDLRGMRVDEVDQNLLPALDRAARADLRIVRVIHGKGTGALRAHVREILSGDGRVAGFRLGAWNEGGDGVTVVELK